MADSAPTTRDRLLEAARELFTTLGYHATTTPILAKRAGVAEGTIYRHFPSKKALLNAAYQDCQRWGTAAIRDIVLAGGKGAGDRLGALGRLWLEHAESDPARVRLLLGWRMSKELDESSRVAANELRLGLEQLVAAGKQEGSVRAGVVELWTSVWLALVGFAAERVATREWGPTHPHALATLDAAWEAIAWRPITTAPPAPAPAVPTLPVES